MNNLRKKDKKLCALIDSIGKIERSVNPNIFEELVKSVVAQQVSTKAAETVFNRLCNLSEITQAGLRKLTVEEIRSCGMNEAKSNYIKNIAQANIDFESLKQNEDDEIISELTQIKGVGIWTVEMLLIFSLGRKDILSYGDLIIKKGICKLYGHKELKKERFLKYKKRYSPYGSIASLYLWEFMSGKNF
ncbi:MAG: DNA-3-methyladenine glycosylase 2 family protein [Defluviitaleaceae bacterium]|nr:DNA-3-methyladenine glycosylase 2 family protein [Defluviitaleaceae bacterium]